MSIYEAWLRLLFHGTSIPGIADNAGAPQLRDFWIGLYASEASLRQGTNEVRYSGYHRVKVARDESMWLIVGERVTPAADIDFPECVKDSASIATHFAIGSVEAGDGMIFLRGALSKPVGMKLGIIPRLEAVKNRSKQ